jgi:hypothetical protein
VKKQLKIVKKLKLECPLCHGDGSVDFGRFFAAEGYDDGEADDDVVAAYSNETNEERRKRKVQCPLCHGPGLLKLDGAVAVPAEKYDKGPDMEFYSPKTVQQTVACPLCEGEWTMHFDCTYRWEKASSEEHSDDGGLEADHLDDELHYEDIRQEDVPGEKEEDGQATDDKAEEEIAKHDKAEETAKNVKAHDEVQGDKAS